MTNLSPNLKSKSRRTLLWDEMSVSADPSRRAWRGSRTLISTRSEQMKNR